jgi:hypothetical protein
LNGIVLCIFQVYRVVLLPFANTWMLWSLIIKLQLTVSDGLWLTQAILLISCFFLSLRVRALLHVPVQLVTVCFSASTAARMCSTSGAAPVMLCMSSVMLMLMVFSVAVPIVITYSIKVNALRRFVPHVQAKRSLFHA